ncbi:Alpha/Beta hydrolase protein [Dactylonectria estremocensis]|uniref:Alpha/Beta hydrolase protein n=1 Tax=Dactylonectria estremocensis TaxID=1079267 RepID=A0A9P9D323_9HYPO|nr:Alpha/Beta hydrolase protein [Dactylonectria estremocensis]KAH7112972.1 Alpha/Beta hydrolase protein [Dactylonectria estremocensis]
MPLRIANVDVVLSSTITPGDKGSLPYAPFNPSTKEISKGHRLSPEHKAFEVDTIFEKDITLPMRDGVKLYADVFRPKTSEKVPAILVWSPYGKTGNGPNSLDMLPGRFGVPQSRVSGYEKFEGLDPALWPARGFAIINADLRGSWDSEGIVPWLGVQDGKDGYDAIEHIAKLDWCSGKVALAGNSWLAMVQWYIAAQQPPSLAAIAPWEGAADFYRDTLCRGGVPYPYDSMWGFLQNGMVGRNGSEAAVNMLEKYPLFNDYWEDKRSKLEDINVPAYILASYSSALHTTGSIRAYHTLASKDKWLRIHPKQEWSDLYDPANIDDLTKFFDYYLRGKKNDWQSTPRVRVSLLGFNKPPVVHLPLESFPLPQTKHTKLYLASGEKLELNPVSQVGSASYDAEFVPKGPLAGGEELIFRHRLTKKTWLLGYSWLVLNIANESEDEIDVFVQLGKADASGKSLVNMNVPLDEQIPPLKDHSEAADSCFLKYLGPTGTLRGSHAVSKVAPEPGKFTGDWPEYTNTTRKAIPAGTITKLEVPIWPTGIIFDEGEHLTLKVSGHYMSYMEFPSMFGATHKNKGRHTVSFGAKFDSHLVVPLLDPVTN